MVNQNPVDRPRQRGSPRTAAYQAVVEIHQSSRPTPPGSPAPRKPAPESHPQEPSLRRVVRDPFSRRTLWVTFLQGITRNHTIHHSTKSYGKNIILPLDQQTAIAASMARIHPLPSPRTASQTHAAPTRSPSSTASNGAASTPASTASRCAPCGSSPSGGRGNVPIWLLSHFSEPSSKTAPSQFWGTAATAAISPTYPTWFVPSNSPSDSREADSRRSTWEQGRTIP